MKIFRYLLLMAVVAASGFVWATGPSNVVWRLPEYSLTARAMDVREALETFAVAEGVPLVQSEAVRGQFSGNFDKVKAGEFLDRVTAMHNLVWYFDGSAIFVSGAGESASALVDLKYMKADEVTEMMRDLGVEDARFPLKRASKDELIMVSGPPRYVQIVTEMIEKADRLREQRTFNEVEVRLFPLLYTWADSVSFSSSGPESSLQIRGVADLLQDLMAERGGAHMRDGTNATDSAEQRIAQAASAGFRPLIRAENRLNAVLVRDVATRMPMYEDIIRQLDRPQKLVEITVTTLEMSKDAALDWQLSLQVSGAHSEMEGAIGQNAANLFSPAGLGGQGLAGAFTYLGKHTDVNASLTALRTKGTARNISRSSILTLNNFAAEMSDSQSYHAKVVGTEVATLEEVTAGTLLQVKPRIVEPPEGATNASAHVWLTMKLQDGGFETITVDAMPMTRTSTVETQASLPDGDSLLLAGYLRDIQEEAGWGIPYLRDIPVIGWLFGGASHKKETVQRLFVLTPHVIDIPYYGSVSQDVTTAQALRLRDVQDAEVIEEEFDRSDSARTEREEALLERLQIRHESEDEKLRRARKERDFRREKRRDDRIDDRKVWEADFTARREEYEKAREEKAKKEAEAK